jgi:hypothetical protein
MATLVTLSKEIKSFNGTATRIAPYCANVTGLHYCLEDPQYPEYDIKLAITQDYLFDKKFSDVVDQGPMLQNFFLCNLQLA